MPDAGDSGPQAGFVLVSVVVLLAVIAGAIGVATRIVAIDVKVQHRLEDNFAAENKIAPRYCVLRVR